MISDQKTVRHYLEILRKISKEAVIGPTPKARLSRLVQIVANELHWDVCSIYILNSKTDKLILTATYGLDPKAIGKVRVTVSTGVVGSAIREEKPLFLENTDVDPRYKYFPETGEEKFHSMAAVPFMQDGKVAGVLTVQTIEPYHFTTSDKHFLEILSSQVGQAVDLAISLKAQGHHKGLILVGTPAAHGIAEARVHLIDSSPDRIEILARGFKGELFEKNLFDNSVQLALLEIEKLKELMGNSSTPALQILTAHKMMLQDQDFKEKVHNNITTYEQSAPRAVTLLIDAYIKTFSSFKNRIMREKVHDLKDLRDTLLRLMGEKINQFDPKIEEEQMIIVANELTPQETARLDPEKVVAFVTEGGSEISHVAILARALQLPAVVGIPDLMDTVKPGDRLLIDGNNGFIYINPDSKLKKRYFNKSSTSKKKIESIKKILSTSANSSNTVQNMVSVNANIGLPLEIDQATRSKINSVGLLRTEFFYMRQSSWPDKILQTQFYERIFRSFSKGTITIRLLDLGGDKFLNYMPELQENNSYFGVRSIRLLLDHPEILRSQLGAIHKTAEYTGITPRILIPMVTHAWEIAAVRETLLEVTKGKNYPLGIMVEIPAAMFQIRELSTDVDFISIGTNDLAQYLLVVDRNNSRVSHLYNPLHPAILRAMDFLYKAIIPLSKEFSVCGEMAGDHTTALALLAIGYRALSLSPSRVLKINYLIRQIPVNILPDMRTSILKSNDPKETKKILQSSIKKYAPLLA